MYVSDDHKYFMLGLVVRLATKGEKKIIIARAHFFALEIE